MLNVLKKILSKLKLVLHKFSRGIGIYIHKTPQDNTAWNMDTGIRCTSTRVLPLEMQVLMDVSKTPIYMCNQHNLDIHECIRILKTRLEPISYYETSLLVS